MRAMVKGLRGLGLLLAVVFTTTAAAVEPDEILADPVLEGRARAISAELRCLVCQNQSIDDSDAPLARDLRLLVRERLQAGDSDTQVIAFLTARYGAFILLRPPFSVSTLLLWGMPVLALVLGGVLMARGLRRAASNSGDAEMAIALDPKERAAIAEILGRETGSEDGDSAPR